MIRFTPHPLLKSPTPEQIVALSKTDKGKESLLRWYEAHEEAVINATRDPIAYGFRMPSWTHCFQMLEKWMEVFAFGGNGSSKSRLGAWIGVQCLLNNPGHRLYCFSQDDDASTQIQQRYIYEHLPPKFKKKTLSETGYLKYSQKNGFTDNSFILDMGDGSEPRHCYFFKYSQYQANKAKFEGYEYGSRDVRPFSIPEQKVVLNGKEWVMPAVDNLRLNVGAWLDEYLEDGDLYDTLLYRIPRRGASIFTTFTPIDHMTAFVADKIKGSQVTATIPTNPKVFPKESDPKTVEWIREKRNSDMAKAGVGMVFMPSEHNPWAGHDNMIVLHSHKTLKERLVRFHGIPSNVITSLFPKFSTNVNVVDQRWKFDPKDHTCYMVCDPAGRRSYACLWAYVNKHGEIHIAAEFPERDIYGDWAKFGTPRWTYSVGSQKVYMSVESYVEEWKKIEEDLGCTVFERIGDSRAFAAENDNSIDRFTDFSRCGMDFVPSDGRPEEIGLQMLDEWFEYDVNQPVDSVNKPLITIHRSCGNLIESLINYNAEGKKDEALKDFVDLMRYLRMANGGEGPEHYDTNAIRQQQPTGGY